MTVGTTYFYYTIDDRDISRTYSIELNATGESNAEEILQKVISIAKSAFEELNREKEKIKEQICEYVGTVREKIRRNPDVSQLEFLALINHLTEYEEAENNRFKTVTNFEEIKTMSSVMLKKPLPVLQHTDDSDSWRHSTYLGRKNSSDIILLQVFKKTLICELEIDAISLEPRSPSHTKSFSITSFEKYLSDLPS